MRLVTLIVLSAFTLKGQYLWQVYPERVVKWNYFDGDEFNRGAIDKSKWHSGFPWGRAIFSQETFVVDSNMTFDEGKIQFAIKNNGGFFALESWQTDSAFIKKNKNILDSQNRYPFKYTGSLLWSRKKYKYGYFEIKFKAPVGQGIWPAFWLYAGNANNEIDFFELKGEKENSLHVDIHCPKGCSNYKEGILGYRKAWGHWIKTDQKLKDNFNVISGEWTPNSITWYLNGEIIAFSNHTFDMDMELVVGTGIAKDGGPFKPGPNKETPFPNYFYVDYVRVYKGDSEPDYDQIKNNLCSDCDSINKTKKVDLKAEKSTTRLKNNPDKKIKQKSLVTVSITQISKKTVSLRVLGISPNNKIIIRISDTSNNVLTEMKTDENEERSIPINENKVLIMHAEINNQIIDERISLQ